MAEILILGTLDSKGHEHAFVAVELAARGHQGLLVDVGSGEDPQVTPHVSRMEVAAAAGLDLATLAARRDRGECVTAMAQAAAAYVAKLHAERGVAGIISLGGGGGTAIATAAMRALPIGIPKVMVSTLAAGNTAHYLGTKDIVMVPSMVDISGLNSFSRSVLARAAGALIGMVETDIQANKASAADRPLLAASMFGNTTKCVELARAILENAGYEVLVFHATGSGGKLMESLIEAGTFSAVLDITTTEWADELVGGVLSAGPQRLDAAAKTGVPTIITPGCLDMVNFGEPHTVPEKFAGRTFYHHNPQVTLMRTSPEECTQLGRILAEKANAYTGPVSVLLPLQGISIISAQGQPFYSPEADAALFQAIRDHLAPHVSLVEVDAGINDPAFAEACAQALLANAQKANAA